MPIPIIKKTAEEIKKTEQAKKYLSFYTEKIENAYKYYLEKVACLAMGDEDVLVIEDDRNLETPLGFHQFAYIIKIGNFIYQINLSLDGRGRELGATVEFLGKDGLFHVMSVNKSTQEYANVVKPGYPIQAVEGRRRAEKSGESQYFNRKTGYAYGFYGKHDNAEKLANEIEDLIKTIKTAYEEQSNLIKIN